MPNASETFDHIVLGAGSAGCVLARRLVDAGRRVLLLEAGGPDTRREIHIPAAFSVLLKSEVDWNFTTAPQARLDRRELYWPRGKVLGGCSSINAMIYIRGHRRDYDGWAENGCEGWSYDDLLPYFRKAEDNARLAPSSREGRQAADPFAEYHGVGGPQPVCDLRDPNPLSRAFVDAAVEAGFPPNDDFNGAEQDGFGLNQVTQKSGRRASAAAGYLKPVLTRRNLRVETGAHVLRLELEGGRAVGVTYLQDDEIHTMRCDGDVVLAAGAVGSPQILLLSGIGPAAHLSELGLPVEFDLPGVGGNLQDHLAVPLTYVCTRPISLARAEGIGSILRYLLFRRGMLTSNAGEAGGFLRTDPSLDAPDLQFIFGPVYYLDHGFLRPDGDGFTLGPILLQPKSRGTVRLASADPLAAPTIDPRYGEADGDLELLVEGLRIARRIAAQNALAPFRGPEHLPGEAATSDQALLAHLREWAFTLYHPVGTCKMGVDDDAVVDPRLRVRGIDNLRVADASILPTITRGNTNAPTLAIAEKAADLILAS